ncbi:hypothetical protein [Chryseobacterium sp. MFBS3-17]|uniref:hypothetical protein n=1 Tax=Chryseobacterium sp. MFBS3-17 TaxID=2886689 RepID=UPI001D0EF2E2|nr:hypothetical protein [Chryseobacterium sp. MFBS3-17]MCC2589749.1 hypothetical protein [Chryseobacterium sp. MFBS3-17]
MNTLLPLSEKEKRVLRKTMISRIALFFVAILPLITFSVYLLYLAAMSFADGSQDVFSFIIPAVILLFYVLGAKYILPPLVNVLRYRKTEGKKVFTTCIRQISKRYIGAKGLVFTLKTDLFTIDTAKDIVLICDIPLTDLAPGTEISIHKLPGIRNEILRISTPLEVNTGKS